MHYWEPCRCLLLLVCSTASSSNAFISSTNFSHRLNRGRLKLSKSPDDGLELDSKEISNLIQAAAIDRSIPSSSLLPVLQYLENQNNQNNIPKAMLDGSFELVYSSAVANFPIIGTWFDGYLPNKEIINFDLEMESSNFLLRHFPFYRRSILSARIFRTTKPQPRLSILWEERRKQVNGIFYTRIGVF